MNQSERCAWLVEKLLAENPSGYADVKIPAAAAEPETADTETTAADLQTLADTAAS